MDYEILKCPMVLVSDGMTYPRDHYSRYDKFKIIIVIQICLN